MRLWGKEGMTWLDIVDRGSAGTEARVALAMECLEHTLATVMLTGGCHKRSRSYWIQSWQYPCADEERLRGELDLIQTIEHNNNCFYTNEYCCNGLNWHSHTIRCGSSIPCLLRYRPFCWRLLCLPCVPQPCNCRLHLCGSD